MDREFLDEWLKTTEAYLKEEKNRIRFASTIYTVKTDDTLSLWREWQNRVNWIQDGNGFDLLIGDINNRPVTVSGFWEILNGQRILTYYGSSRLVDYDMIDAWLDKHCNPKTLDGMQARADIWNFGNVAREIEKRTGIPIGPNESYCNECNRDRLYPPLCARCVNYRVKNQIYFSEKP